MRRLEASWRRLRPSWRRLGPSWRHLRPSWKVLVRVYEVQEVSGRGGVTKPAADFRSLNEKFEREEGRYRR